MMRLKLQMFATTFLITALLLTLIDLREIKSSRVAGFRVAPGKDAMVSDNPYVSFSNIQVGRTTTTSPEASVTSDSSTSTRPATEHAVASGLAHTSSRLDQVVVIGRSSGQDTSWVDQLETHEANVYLTYILDNYHNLPSTIASVHAHGKGYPQAWHTDAEDNSHVRSLQQLNVEFVSRNGYANLRCIAIPGCPDEVQPFREPYKEDRKHEHALPEVWRYIFKNDDVPHVVSTPCCAQLAVSKDQVLERPLTFYMRAHQWLMCTSLDDDDDDTNGRVFEYLWHVIFGQAAVYCPDLQQCYKDVYNK
ncbi:hypothetical protein E4T42_00923 [Aureobasidium subglaciale]|nr:hypothetical protein E4T42_00923 [Aureobasidium subglaciale]